MKNFIVCILLALIATTACRQQKAAAPPSIARIDCDSALLSEITRLLDYKNDDSTLLLEMPLKKAGDCHLPKNDTLVAEAWRCMGAVYVRRKDNESARQCFLNGLRNRIAHSGYVHPQVQRFHFNLGLTHFNTRQYHQALVYFDSALIDRFSLSHLPYYYRAIMLRGNTYLRLGQYTVAEYFLLTSLPSMQEPGATAADFTEIYMYLSDCQRHLKKYGEAITNGNRGIEFLRQKRSLPADERLLLAGCHLNTGNAWQDSMLTPGLSEKQRKHAGQMAVLHTEKALQVYRRMQSAELVADAARNLGELYRRLGDTQKASALLSETLSRLPTEMSPGAARNVLMAQLYLNRGEVRLDENRLPAAASDFDSALYFLAPDYVPGRDGPLPSLNGCLASPSTTLMLLGDIAALAIRQFEAQPSHLINLEKAITAYDSLLLETDRLRSNYLTEEAKIDLSQEARPYLNKAFQTCIKLFQNTRDNRHLEIAFQIAEQRKSIVLLESMRFSQLLQHLPARLQAQLQTLNADRNAISEARQVYRGDPLKMAEINERWSAHIESRRKFQDSLNRYAPGFYSRASLSPEVIRQQLIDPDQGMLEYFTLDSNLYIFSILGSGITVDSLRIDSTFYACAGQMVRCLAAGPLSDQASGSEEASAFLRQAHYMYARLLPPGRALPRRLVVVPDEPFITLPFEVLVSKVSPGGFREQAKSGNFLLYDHEFSYCYSANLLWEMQQTGKNGEQSFVARKTVAAFAPEFHDELRDSTHRTGGVCSYLKPILNEKEVVNIKRQVSAQIFKGPAATKQNFLQACRKYDIVHVATHGILNNDNPGLNFISFSQTRPEVNTGEFLYLQELDTCHLNLELAVFSACETARGKNVANEGNISMARGLAQAGVRSFITTLSAVRPQQTGELMPILYTLLTTGEKTKDAALAEAKRRFIENSADNAHPAAWANVVLMGVTDPVALQRTNFWSENYGWLLVLLLASTTGYFFLRRKVT